MASGMTRGRISLVTLFITALAAAGSASAGEERLDILFSQALSAGGKEYISARNALVMHPDIEHFAARKLELAEPWQDRLLAEIVIERLAHGEEIRAALQPPESFPHFRRSTERIAKMRRMLCEKFKSYPLVLVEFLWKGNELENYFWGRRLAEVRKSGVSDSELPRSNVVNEKEAYVISALGLLEENRAAPVLVQWLSARATTGNVSGEWNMVSVFSETLREIRAVQQCLPELLRIAETATSEIVKGAAVKTVTEGGLTPEAIPLLEGAAAKATDPLVRKQLGYLVQTLRDIDRLHDTGDGTQSGHTEGQKSRPAATAPVDSGPTAAQPRLSIRGFTLGLFIGLLVGASVASGLLLSAARRRRTRQEGEASRGSH